MKGITLCAECAYYSMKKHRCTRGATDEGEPTDRFYADCPFDDVVPAVHGLWIEKQTTIQCSNCGKEYNDEIRCMCYGEDAELNHCPKCGAAMDEKE